KRRRFRRQLGCCTNGRQVPRRTLPLAKIGVVGAGYVGLVTGACFADLGNDVTCIDVDENRIATLRQGHLPIYEPQLEELISRNVAAGRLHFTGDYSEGIAAADFACIAVGTPSAASGAAAMRYCEAPWRCIG